jgi:4'-phosphopantetheinyl transferase EntD
MTTVRRPTDGPAGGPSGGLPSGLLDGLLPAGVVVVESFADPPPVDLFPQEAAAMAEASEARRREFAGVRWCARTALARLGCAPGPLAPAGEGPAFARGAPRWPAGFVGSMTHCEGYRAAAVARTAVAASLGVDAEPNRPVPDRVLTRITLPEERHTLDRITASHPGVAWDRLLFSAKESVYKAWFPLTGRWLDFTECAVTLHPARGTFTATLLVPGPVVAGIRLTTLPGRWRVRPDPGGGHLATALALALPMT